jgi:uncharacterized repeat protein (TIGR01451 family)
VKQVLKLLAVLALTGFAAVFFLQGALAQNTTAGTVISNTATATFVDSGGATRNTTSNTVTTTVQTVYSFNIEPDDANAPTATTTFPGAAESDSLNSTSGTDATNTAYSGSVTADTSFSYVVTNNTNNTSAANQVVTVRLNVLQETGGSSTDNFDFTNIRVYTFTDTNNNDRFDIGETLSASPLFTGTASGDLTFTAQGQETNVVVFADIPATATGNQIARLDLVGANQGNTLGGAPTVGANTSYETNNIARTEVTEIPQIALAKNLDSLTNNGDGTYDVQYTFNVANIGNVALSSVQITDTLPFTPAANITIVSTTLSNATGGLTANASYNGGTNTNLLSGTNTLAIAGTGSIRLVVRVRPLINAGLTTYNNTATATAESPDNPVAAGADTSDISDNGTDVRGTGGDGDNLPGEANENDATPVTLSENPQIGLAKQAGTITNAADGDFIVPFTLTLENLGNVNLHDIQITESLADFGTYAATVAAVDTAGEYTVTNLSVNDATATPLLTLNSAFTGSGANTGIFNLTSNAVLERTQTITVTFNVRFYPNLATSPFFNQASASGDVPRNANGTASGNATDLSDDGTDPDPDGDGLANEQLDAYDANNDGTTGATEGVVTDPDTTTPVGDTTTNENTPTLVTLTTTARIGVAKQAGTVTDNANGTFTVPFTFNIENLGNIDLYDVQVTDTLSGEFGTFQTGATDAAKIAAVDAAGEYTVTAIALTDTTPGTDLTLNTAYTGSTPNTTMFTVAGAANENLALEVGQTVTVTFNLTFYPNFANSPFTNQATATGDAPDAGGNGNGAANADTTDTSDNGTDPDPDGDGNPNETNTPAVCSSATPTNCENDVTPVPVTATPRVGSAKSAGTVTSNNDGTFTVPFTITLQNYGNVDLYDVQATDVLSAEFGTYQATAAAVDSAGEYTVSNVALTDTTPGTDLALNTGFTGTAPNTNLLTVSAANNALSLEVNQSVTISFDLRFYPNTSTATVSGNNLTFQNQVTAAGDAPDAGGDGNGTQNSGTTDLSDSGTNPDSDGDRVANEQLAPYDLNNDGTISPATEGRVTEPTGDGIGNDTTNDNNDPTLVTITMAPVIGVAKAAGTVTDNNDGTFSVPFTINVRNYGNVDAHDVQIVENLATEFGTFGAATPTAAGNYTVSGLSITTNAATALTANAIGSSAGQFNGSGTNTNLLSVTSGGHIRPGETVTLTFTLRFFPNFTNATLSGNSATFTNQVTAQADNPNNNDNVTNSNTTDTSDSGTNPDTDGQNDPNEAGENDPTDVVVTMNPVIGVAKTASITNGDTDSNPATAGPYEITFDLYLENLGNTNLTSVTLTDPLTQFGTLDAGGTFATGEYQVVSGSPSKISGPTTITANSAFTGTTPNTGVINTGSLLVGETAQLRVVIRVNNVGAFTNVATATGNGPGTTSTTDTSDSGTDPDPDGDRDPDEPGEDTPTPVNLDAVQLAKSQRICDDADCVGEATSPVATALTINPNNYIEYTIVARNLGGQPVTTTLVTDPIPVSSRFVTSTRTQGTITCSTAGAAGPYGACPTTTATGSTTVTHVRFSVGSLTANDNAAGGTDEATVRFVVYIP